MKKLAFLLVCFWSVSAAAAPYLGDYVEDETVHFIWHSSDSSGASITRATDGTVSVYKDNGVAQSVAGVTDTEDFDSLVGVHVCTIITTDAFYVAGADYSVVLSAATIDGQTVNAVIANFSIENRSQEADVIKWLGTAVATPTTAGVPETDMTYWLGVAPLALASQRPQCEVDAYDGSVDFNATQDGSVKAQVVAVLKTDTSTLPGQVTPTNTPTIEEMIEFLYKAWKNEKRQTETEFQLYDPTGVTVDQKATVSDAAGVTTVEEIVSGP